MAAEELKRVVREYANREHPGWDVASITISRGPGEKPETLVITPKGEISVTSVLAESLS